MWKKESRRQDTKVGVTELGQGHLLSLYEEEGTAGKAGRNKAVGRACLKGKTEVNAELARGRGGRRLARRCWA